MTALTAPRAPKERSLRDIGYPMDAGIKIFGGALVALSAAGDARPAGNGTTSRCVGLSTDTVDNTAGVAGDKTVVVRRSCFPFSTSDITRADIGQTAYALDDQTVTKTAPAGTPAKAGEIVDVELTGTQVQVWVDLSV